MNSELKSCPFCGGKVTLCFGFGMSNMLCDKCGAVVSFRGKEARNKTISAWNRRAESEEAQ